MAAILEEGQMSMAISRYGPVAMEKTFIQGVFIHHTAPISCGLKVGKVQSTMRTFAVQCKNNSPNAGTSSWVILLRFVV